MSEHFFPVKLPLRIDWSELDYFGHVNNVSFFKYIQAARVNYWDQIGLTQSHRETNIGPMLASCHCDFKKPLFYPGNITIQSRVDYIKNTSFSICHQILNEEGEVAAEARDVMVMFDFNTNAKTPFPADLLRLIEKLENKHF
ncbi:MAG TPA: acyl-CoA thioesterase [Bacteroidetes bacterium]|nr:acyl-CoA thioesterase [Bacteroidota bacterium]